MTKAATRPRRPSAPASPRGVIRAIVSVTGVVDDVADLIMPGAYAVTLKKRRPKCVDSHDWKLYLGRVLHIEEWKPGDARLPKKTPQGAPWPKEAGALVATIQFNLRTQRGRDAYEMARFYAETGEAFWSIGYKVTPGLASKRGDGVRVIYGLDLYEVSPVLFGAHPMTSALEVKSLTGSSAAAAVQQARDIERKYLPMDRKGAEPMAGRGVMVALFPPEQVATQLARPDGTKPEDLHITLAYLGDAENLGTDPQGIADVLRRDLPDWNGPGPSNLKGSLGGIGAFPSADSGMPVWVPVDVPGLTKFQLAVQDALFGAGHGPRVASSHGFTPHLTLGYDLELGEPIPSVPVEFDTVWLVVGSERFPIGLSEAPTAAAAPMEAKSAAGVVAFAHRLATKTAQAGPVAAGCAVRAKDTGRLLMLQRALSDDDPAAGRWEFPGGGLDDGEDPEAAARREFAEETGVPAPDGDATGQWDASNGKYRGFVVEVPTEADVPINVDHEDRKVRNPDDPDGDQIETLAWWHPDDLDGNPAVRSELAGDLDRVRAALRGPMEAKALPKTQTCAYCSEQADRRVIWADGRAYIPTCPDCETKARHRIVDENQDEVTGVRPIEAKALSWDEALHPRGSAGSGKGGQFVSKGSGYDSGGGGKEGQKVKALQRQLVRLGYLGKGQGRGGNAVDGLFGRHTQGAVKAWQKASGFKVTGKVSASDLMSLRRTKKGGKSSAYSDPLKPGEMSDRQLRSGFSSLRRKFDAAKAGKASLSGEDRTAMSRYISEIKRRRRVDAAAAQDPYTDPKPKKKPAPTVQTSHRDYRLTEAKMLDSGAAGCTDAPPLGRRKRVHRPGAAKAAVVAAMAVPRLETKMAQMTGSFEQRQTLLREAVTELLFPAAEREDGCPAPWVCIEATFPDRVFVSACIDGKDATWQIPYTLTGDGVSLGSPEPVELEVVAVGGTVDADAVETARYVEPAIAGLTAVTDSLARTGMEAKTLAARLQPAVLALLDQMAVKGMDVGGMVMGDDEPDPDEDDDDYLDEDDVAADMESGGGGEPAGDWSDLEGDDDDATEPDDEDDMEEKGVPMITLDPASVQADLARFRTA